MLREHDSPMQSLDSVRENILDTLLIAIAICGFFPLAASLYRIVDMGWQNIITIHVVAYIAMSSMAVLRRKLIFRLKALVLIFMCFLIGCLAIVNMGIIGSGFTFMIFSVIFATMFFDVRFGGMLIAVSSIVFTIVAFGVSQGWIGYDFDFEATAKSLSSWITKISAFVFFSTLLIIALDRLISNLFKSSIVLKERTLELQQSNSELLEKISEIGRTKENLIKSERNYREIFNASSDAIFILDGETGEILDVNLAMLNMYGYEKEETLGLKIETFSSRIPPYCQRDAENRIKQAVEERPQIFEWQAKKKNDEIFWVEVNLKYSKIGTETKVIAVVRDITERKKTLEVLIQNEKMMSVGGLAAGMAHELNNPLGGILQGIQNIQRRLSPDLKSNHELAQKLGIDLQNLQVYMEKRQIISYFDGILESGKKASQIILNMLQFSRGSESKKTSVNLIALIENVLELAGKDYNLKKKYDFRNIKIIRDFDSDLPLVTCTETEVEQVVLNLLNNAAWAMAIAKKDAPPQITLRVNAENRMARIEIEDNGPGMEEAVRSKIFEPFFTTKSVGEGTGLGLSVSYMIITNNHQGTMEVASEPGKGTRFIIQLPLNGQ